MAMAAVFAAAGPRWEKITPVAASCEVQVEARAAALARFKDCHGAESNS